MTHPAILVLMLSFGTMAGLSRMTVPVKGSHWVTYPANPLPAHTGGFGEKSCHTCHFDSTLNDPAGSLRVSWGNEQGLKVELRHPALVRGGFQLSARYADGDRAGTQAGTFIPVDDLHSLETINGISYLSHTHEGGTPTRPGFMEWIVKWVPPADSGKVVFHVSAVAANGDESQFEDVVYTAEFLSAN
jgi:hypothetical protein